MRSVSCSTIQARELSRYLACPTVADICLIYARSSKKVVQALVDVLSARYSVWWDQHIHAGDYRAEIERQSSRTNQNVLDEASFATRHHVPLLPIRIEPVDSPLGFGGLHTVDLIGWNGEQTDRCIQDLLRNIESTILTRPEALNIGDKRLHLPVFFRSVSSHETALRPTAALHALRLVPPDALLVSAYDICNEPEQHRNQMIVDLESSRSVGTLVLLDSGNYELECPETS